MRIFHFTARTWRDFLRGQAVPLAARDVLLMAVLMAAAMAAAFFFVLGLVTLIEQALP